MSFSSFGLSEHLLKAIEQQNYKQPYPIQKEAIPVIASGKDVMGIAKTGSGKTAAFVIPLLELLQKQHKPKVRHISTLVLVPTRELAMQVNDVFDALGFNLPKRIKTLAVYGGVSINPQMMALNYVDVLVATPGRLLELIEKNAVSISETKFLVLDEADKMLNLGFKEEMTKILALLPKQRQNILFSATLGEAVTNLNHSFLTNPVTIEIKEEEQSIDLIKQIAYMLEPERKGVFLRYLIKTQNMQQVLVFVSATKRADNVATKLNKNGIEAAAFHSQKSQGARTDALARFKKGKLRVLVATDLASRGIDIQFLPYVINYELPRSPVDYVHRIGRTGRAEASGEAITLLCPEDAHHFKIIQKKMKKQVTILQTSAIDLKGF